MITVLLAISPSQAAIVIGFEELNQFTGNNPAGGGQYYNGNDGSNVSNTNGWSSGGVFFSNSYNSSFGGFWSGWAYSNVVNATSAGFTNQYAAYPGGGANGSQNYAIAYDSGAFFNLPTGVRLSSVSLANGTYTALSMLNGDFVSKKFGGPSGSDPDFFSVSLLGFDGLNGAGSLLGSVTVDLADFTFADNSQDFILSSWLNVDLTPLGNSRSVALSFSSSDVGPWGINTPVYVAMDNLTLIDVTAVPEPSSLALLSLFASGLIWRRRGLNLPGVC